VRPEPRIYSDYKHGNSSIFSLEKFTYIPELKSESRTILKEKRFSAHFQKAWENTYISTKIYSSVFLICNTDPVCVGLSVWHSCPSGDRNWGTGKLHGCYLLLIIISLLCSGNLALCTKDSY
jgi:hypothetical protein